MTKFKTILSELGLTLEAASKKSGLPFDSIASHSQGRRRISAEYAIKYERLLGIPREETRPDLWPPKNETENQCAGVLSESSG